MKQREGNGEMEKKIHVNQVGYDVNGKKLAILANASGEFLVYKKGEEKPVFKGVSRGADTSRIKEIDEASCDRIAYLDFSPLCDSGE